MHGQLGSAQGQLGSIHPRSQCVGGMLLVQWCILKHVLNCLTSIACSSTAAEAVALLRLLLVLPLAVPSEHHQLRWLLLLLLPVVPSHHQLRAADGGGWRVAASGERRAVAARAALTAVAAAMVAAAMVAAAVVAAVAAAAAASGSYGDPRRWRRRSAPRSPPIAAAPRGRP